MYVLRRIVVEQRQQHVGAVDERVAARARGRREHARQQRAHAALRLQRRQHAARRPARAQRPAARSAARHHSVIRRATQIYRSGLIYYTNELTVLHRAIEIPVSTSTVGRWPPGTVG